MRRIRLLLLPVAAVMPLLVAARADAKRHSCPCAHHAGACRRSGAHIRRHPAATGRTASGVTSPLHAAAPVATGPPRAAPPSPHAPPPVPGEEGPVELTPAGCEDPALLARLGPDASAACEQVRETGEPVYLGDWEETTDATG